MSGAVLSHQDLERRARSRLPSSLFAYVSSGAEDGSSLANSRQSFNQWHFLPRALNDVSRRTQQTELFGVTYASPVGIAPMGIAALCCHDGDRKLARAASQLQIPFLLSGASTTALEGVVKVNEHVWFQAYLSSQWEEIEALAQRVWAAGIQTLVVTVDVPVAAIRETELRSGFSVPLRLRPRLVLGALARPRWLMGTFARTLATDGVPHFENLTARRGGPIIANGIDHRSSRAALSWDHLKRLREIWRGRLVIKGLLNPDDVVTAGALGADGVIVSNHGGRQLDGAISPLDALPQIIAARPATVVMMDGGVRRGTDVIKALALGASFVFAGRLAMYGLASDGQPGVEAAFQLIRREIDINLALLGCPSISGLKPTFLVRRN